MCTKKIMNAMSLIVGCFLLVACKDSSQTIDKEPEKDIVINDEFTEKAFQEYIAENFDINDDGKLSDDEISKVSVITINGFQDAKFKSLKSLDGIEIFAELKDLTCYECGLTEIDVSKNIKLESLVVGHTDLKELDVSNNVKLQVLDIDDTDIEKLDLSGNSAIKRLSIGDTQINEIDLSMLEELITFDCAPNIQNLDVTNNKKLEGLSIDNTKILEIDLSQNVSLANFSCVDAEFLTSVDFSGNPNLTSIYCQRSGVKELDISDNPEMFEVECDEDTVIIGGDDLTYLQRFPEE